MHASFFWRLSQLFYDKYVHRDRDIHVKRQKERASNKKISGPLVCCCGSSGKMYAVFIRKEGNF